MPVDPIRVVTPSEFKRSRRDGGASEQVARIRSEQAKREAITHYRAGRHDAAHDALNVVRDYAMSAPMPAADTTVGELDALLAADPTAPSFETVRRRTLNDAHRRARGRDA